MNKKNKILTALFLSITLFFSGCYEIDSAQTTQKQPTVQNTTDYKNVIASLEGKATTIEEYMQLAAAYMSKSGLTLEEVMEKICNSASTTNSFMTFVGSVDDATQMCSTALEDVNKATDYYMLIIGDRCEKPDSLNTFEKNVCLYKGLAQTLQAANTINYIQNTDLTPNAAIQASNRLKASSCAMQYASNGESGECSISDVDTIYFAESDREYDRIAVYSDGEEFEFLLTSDKKNREVIVTNGFCTLDNFSTRFDYSDLEREYFACPISTTPNTPEITITNSLIDSFNEGAATILAVSDSNSDLVTSITQFQNEISLQNNTSSNESTSIIREDVVSYINTQDQYKD